MAKRSGEKLSYASIFWFTAMKVHATRELVLLKDTFPTHIKNGAERISVAAFERFFRHSFKHERQALIDPGVDWRYM